MATTITVQVPDVPADVLEGLDGEMIVDSIAMREVARGAVDRICRELGEIAEGGDEIRGADLRSIADRLQRLAPLAEEVYG